MAPIENQDDSSSSWLEWLHNMSQMQQLFLTLVVLVIIFLLTTCILTIALCCPCDCCTRSSCCSRCCSSLCRSRKTRKRKPMERVKTSTSDLSDSTKGSRFESRDDIAASSYVSSLEMASKGKHKRDHHHSRRHHHRHRHRHHHEQPQPQQQPHTDGATGQKTTQQESQLSIRWEDSNQPDAPPTSSLADPIAPSLDLVFSNSSLGKSKGNGAKSSTAMSAVKSRVSLRKQLIEANRKRPPSLVPVVKPVKNKE